MTNKEFQDKLRQFPDDAELWMGVWNGYVETYGVVDEVYDDTYLKWSNDFFGTPGRMDRRLFDNHKGHEHDDDLILCISSHFGAIKNKDVDFGDDDINYPIKTLNGEDGDPDLVWHLNQFEEIEPKNGGMRYFIRKFDVDENGNFSYVSYIPEQDTLRIRNLKLDLKFSGRLTGIEDVRNAMAACKVPFTLCY